MINEGTDDSETADFVGVVCEPGPESFFYCSTHLVKSVATSQFGESDTPVWFLAGLDATSGNVSVAFFGDSPAPGLCEENSEFCHQRLTSADRLSDQDASIAPGED